MNFKKFKSSQIIYMKPLEKTEWGFVFFKEDNIRYSIDVNDGFIIVEAKKTRDWICVYSYEASDWPRTKSKYFNNFS